MKVSDKDVLYVAALANLELTEKEREHMVRDLNSILDYVERLTQLDTSDVPPMAQVSGGFGTPQRERSDAMRDDDLHGLRTSLSHEDALANAPQADATFFLVPKVIER